MHPVVATTGFARRLAAIVVLGGFPLLAAYGALWSARAAEPGGRLSATGPTGLSLSLPSSQVEIKATATPGVRKGYTRVAEVPRGQAADSAPIGDDDQSRPATYRTLCVRLCDGYYFPISFATPRWRLARDASVCQSRCGAEVRLFVHPNPGAPEDTADLDGVPYSKLPTAFLYRTQYIPSCKCQPHPWEPEALRRHATAALIAAARAGDKAAAKKLLALPADKPTVLRKADTADPDGGGRKARRRGLRSKAKVAASADSGWGDDGMMPLGRKRARGGSRSSRSTARADSDWRKSVFQAY